jgi:hypothetical protein
MGEHGKVNTEEAAKLYSEGSTLQELAGKYGVHHSTVRTNLIRAGIDIRLGADAMARGKTVREDGRCAYCGDKFTYVKMGLPRTRCDKHRNRSLAQIPRKRIDNLLDSTTVSCSGLDITIACDDHETKDLIMQWLTERSS